MSDDGGGDIFRLSQGLFGLGFGVAQPGDVEIVVTGGDGLAREPAPPAVFALLLPLRAAIRIGAIGFLEILEVSDGQRAGLAESGHVSAHVVDPDGFRVRLVSLAALEEQYVGLDALRIENARRQAQDRVQVA